MTGLAMTAKLPFLNSSTLASAPHRASFCRRTTHLAVNRPVAESTQNQALGAILFLYRQVVTKDLGCLDAARRRPKVMGYRSRTNTLTRRDRCNTHGKRGHSSFLTNAPLLVGATGFEPATS